MKGYDYPLLKEVARTYAGYSLRNTLLLACQHLLDPQREMFELLLKAGLKPENCIIAGKNYSTCNSIKARLEKCGCTVAPFSNEFSPRESFDDWFADKLDKFIADQLQNRRPSKFQTVIILDDGGFMHAAFYKLFSTANNVVGIEQTSSGHHRIQALNLPFPTAPVARSVRKLHWESPYVAMDALFRIQCHLVSRGKQNPNILVFGLGPIGRQIAGRLFLESQYDGRATDPNLSDHEAVHLISNRIISSEEARRSIGEYDVIIGATGSNILRVQDISRLHQEVSLISLSSSDREFPAALFRKSDQGVHDNYWFGSRCLVNGGFPITFDGQPHALPPHQIELTIALLMSRVFDGATRHLVILSLLQNRLDSMWQPDRSL